MEPVVLRGNVTSGYGSGSGYGYGSGYGFGYGSGDGYSKDGYETYWRSALSYIRQHLPAPQQAYACEMEAAGALLAFWRSDANGCAANGGHNAPARVGTIETATGPLRDECGSGQLHATFMPTKWCGERWWVVALIGDLRGDDEKYWALQRVVIGEIL